MTKLTVLRGCSGSGKSYWANQQNATVVSRDALRYALYGEYWGGKIDEDVITAAEDAAVAQCLSNGKDCIVDDTSIKWQYVRRLAAIGDRYNAEVELKVFDTPLDQCLKNNQTRYMVGGREVPESVIREQYKRFQANKNKQLEKYEWLPYIVPPDADTYIFDLDGCLAHNNGHRGHYEYDKVIDDAPHKHVVAMAKALWDAGYKIVIMSGRDESCKQLTEIWLKALGVEFNDLFMRLSGDRRSDEYIKYELFNEHIRDKYKVLAAIDDRPRLHRMYRRLGIPTFTMGNPYIEF